MKVASKEQAWLKVYELCGVESHAFEMDYQGSKVAGYPIYRSEEDSRNYVCVLGDRLELNLSDGKSINLWINRPLTIDEYADNESETVSIRSYENGNSKDTLRNSTPEEKAILFGCIGGALRAIRNGMDKQNAMDMAEWILASYCRRAFQKEEINGYDSVYNKIRFCPEDILNGSREREAKKEVEDYERD